MWGIIPAAGRGSRIQPLAFSKELLPVGSRIENGSERPCAVSEFLTERMVRGGADKLCFVISPGKSDILEYFGSCYYDAAISYVVQDAPSGLCDAVFRARPFIRPDEPVPVSYSGGVFEAGTLILDPLRRHLAQQSASYKFRPPRLPPSLGAAIHAAKLAGEPLSAAAMQRLARNAC